MMGAEYKKIALLLNLINDKLDYLIENDDYTLGPTANPPDFVPNMIPMGSPEGYAIDPGAITPCLNKYVYLWLENGKSFWAYLTFVGRRSASGYRWNCNRWVYFSIDLKRIDSFVCY